MMVILLMPKKRKQNKHKENNRASSIKTLKRIKTRNMQKICQECFRVYNIIKNVLYATFKY
jgi:hypothetical protein